jgi:alpha-L-fucosidase
MWFDFSYWQMTGEAWRASELVSMIHALQPRIVIDNRLGGDMHASDPVSYAGDFANPEQGIPREGLVNADGLPIPWEASVTLNNNWGYSASDHDYKSAAFIIRALVNAVSKGGNLIVNVGPNAYGEIPRPSQAILQEVGAWMARNGESIYGCGPAACPKPEWGRYTQCGHSLYAHVLEQVAGHINLQGLKNALEKARLLTDGSEVLLTDFWNAEVDSFDGPTDIFMNFAHPVQATFPLPDAIDTVVKLILR